MNSRETIMTWLEVCGKDHNCSDCCPYGNGGETFSCKERLMEAAFNLLKEKKQKKVRCIRRLTKVMKGICPSCEMEIESVIYGRLTKFCKFCGQVVKWE